MAIQVRKKLVASPNPTTLPNRVDFRQTLRSNQNAEPITAVYATEPDHEVWFLDGQGKQTKEVTRTETVSTADQPVLDQIRLERGPGRGPMPMVQITKTITDSSGIKITGGVCILRIEA